MPGATTFKSALSAGLGLKLEPAALGPDDIAFLQYTGGTTGVAKAAILTHRNMVANVLPNHSLGVSIDAEHGRPYRHHGFAAVPYFRADDQLPGFPALRSAEHTHTIRAIFPAFVVGAQKYKFNSSAASTRCQRIAQHAGFEAVDFRALKVILRRRHGAPRSGRGALEKNHGCVITQGWG